MIEKLAMKILEINDNVYVVFPVKQIGQSTKVCSFRPRPFQIKERLCVNSGRNGTYQVTYIDCIKGAKSQTLSDETEEHLIPDINMPNEIDLQNDPLNLPEEKEQEDNKEQGSYSKYGRQRKKSIREKKKSSPHIRSFVLERENHEMNAVLCSVECPT